MIRYALKCAEGHGFESWFQSAAAYEKLRGAGMVTCTLCGSTEVEKALMAPRVRPGRKAASAPAGEAVATPSAGNVPSQNLPAQTAPAGPAPTSLAAPSNELEAAIAELKKQVEANSDYVGKDFVKEARDMHLGDAPARSIHGEAKPEEAKALIEEGVPVVPLPFAPTRKTN